MGEVEGLSNFNAEFMQWTRSYRNAFVPWIGSDLDGTLCERFGRTVGWDNCVNFAGTKLQIPADCYRCDYEKDELLKTPFKALFSESIFAP